MFSWDGGVPCLVSLVHLILKEWIILFIYYYYCEALDLILKRYTDTFT